jgi:hypothetical protein
MCKDFIVTTVSFWRAGLANMASQSLTRSRPSVRVKGGTEGQRDGGRKGEGERKERKKERKMRGRRRKGERKEEEGQERQRKTKWLNIRQEQLRQRKKMPTPHRGEGDLQTEAEAGQMGPQANECWPR